MEKRKQYTPEQIFELESNPYTHHVTATTIVFTLEFKKHLLEQASKPGMTFRKVAIGAGYDPELLPPSYFRNYLSVVRKEAASPGGLKPPKGPSTAEKLRMQAKERTSKEKDAEIEALKERVAKLEEQILFLKKISSIKKTALQNPKDTSPP